MKNNQANQAFSASIGVFKDIMSPALGFYRLIKLCLQFSSPKNYIIRSIEAPDLP